MASYTAVMTAHHTTTGAQVDTVTLGPGNKRDVRVQHRGVAGTDPGIWWTWGYATPADPASDGSVDGSYFLPAGAVDRIREPISRDNETTVIVKVLSTGAMPYSIEGS